MSLPEVLLWRTLRGQALGGLRFRRQHPLGPFVLDFYCDAARLAVEVDGAGHHQPARRRHDLDRDAWLAQRGVRTLRIPARVVLKDMRSALETILAEAGARPSRS